MYSSVIRRAVTAARHQRELSSATSSILTPRASVNVQGETVEVVTKGRHDPCVGIRGTPVVAAMMALFDEVFG